MVRQILSLLTIIALTCTPSYSAEPIAIAHRGLLRHAPENTLAAFAACLELRMGFELDIRTTADGHLVVIHDDNLQRTTNGPAKSVRDITLAQLKELDAGSWFASSFSRERVPTLEEVFQLIKTRKHADTIIALNVKHITPDGERKLILLMKKYDMFEISFAFDQSVEISKRLKQLDVKLRVGQNVNRSSIDLVLMEDFVDVFLLSDTPTGDEVKKLHQAGKFVLFNYAGAGEHRRSEAAWRQACEAGIDGMLTDYPTLCLQFWRSLNVSSEPDD